MSDVLNGVSDKELTEAYARLKKMMMAELTASIDLKDAEQKLKDDIVQDNQFYKKDHVTPDYSKVKLPLLKQAIEIVENKGKNKLAEQLDILDGYIADIKSDRISKAAINGFVRKTSMIAEAKQNFKDVKENMKSEINGDIVEALVMLAKLEVGHEKERLSAEDGAAPRSKKEKGQIEGLIAEIRSKLNK